MLVKRWLVVQGNEGSSSSEYGGTMTTYCEGGNACATTRLNNVLFTRMGQSGLKGRHPVYFNRVGDQSASFVQNCVVHQSYNRGIVLASTNQLRIDFNGLYDIKGHGIVLEDGNEVQNYIANNWAMINKKSFTFMTTDTLPAGFYITNPDNLFVNNKAYGSERFGFWYDL